MSSVVVLLSFPVFVLSALSEVTVRPGEDAALQCRGPRDAAISLLEWSRPELIADGYVFFFQNQRSYENYQHESFRGRVQLRDPNMKDGDVSVVLRNVSVRDAGTYECEITGSSFKGAERVTEEFQHFISLTVTVSGFTGENTKDGGHKDGGHKDAFLSVLVSVSVFIVVLLIVIVCKISCRTSDRHNLPESKCSTADEEQ